jgi:hypothetical protein
MVALSGAIVNVIWHHGGVTSGIAAIKGRTDR